LATDRERARQKKEAEAVRQQAEKQEREKADVEERFQRNMTQWTRWRAGKLRPEPGAYVKDAVRISIRLLDGQRVTRRFAPDAPIEEMYAFVECYDIVSSEDVLSEKGVAGKPEGFEHKYVFRLVSPMPRQVYDVNDSGSIRENIGRSGSLIVERVDVDGDDDEE